MGEAGQEQVATTGEVPAPGPGWFNRAAYGLFWLTVGSGLRLYFRLKVENRPKLQGAYVLAPNHASLLDPILLGAASHRRIAFMMTEVIYRSPSMGWFYRWNHSIPVSVRGSNRDALRDARAVLRSGRVLGIFPEGGLSRDGGLMLGNPGAISLVLGESVPIIPVGILGLYDCLPVDAGFPSPGQVTVRFGEPIAPDQVAALGKSRKARLQAATALIMERIAELTEQETRESQLATWG